MLNGYVFAVVSPSWTMHDRPGCVLADSSSYHDARLSLCIEYSIACFKVKWGWGEARLRLFYQPYLVAAVVLALLFKRVEQVNRLARDHTPKCFAVI